MSFKEPGIYQSWLHRGERGFTLLEILVVVAILGTLAAIVIPSILSLRSEGQVEAANTERYNVQIAVLSAMVEEKISSITGGTIGPGNSDVSQATDNTTTIPEVDSTAYIYGILQAVYTIDGDGRITDASIDGLQNSKWQGLSFDPGAGWSE
jgi:type IV pilus assembly protein PilA